MIIHLVDGTYELFRQFHGRRRFLGDDASELFAAAAVLHSILEMIEDGATHIGVATDHVIESFRNNLWDDYKTGEGVEPELLAQFHPLEEALAAMGVTVWPMVELEADDGLASAARLAGEDDRVEKVCIWANDKDLATLRTDAPLFDDVDELRWTGPGDGWEEWAERIGDDRLFLRATEAAEATAAAEAEAT